MTPARRPSAAVAGEGMVDNPRRRNGTRRTHDRNRLRAEGRPCWICRAFGRDGTIDYSLPAGHPLSFEMDELIPVSHGGRPTYDNSDAAHRCCNEWRGNKSVQRVLQLAAQARGEAPADEGRGDGLPQP